MANAPFWPPAWTTALGRKRLATDATRFDALTRSLHSRRGALAALSTVLGLAQRSSWNEDAAAKKKKPCPPCKKRKQGKCKPQPNGTTCTGGNCQSGSCVATPPPPGPAGPVTTADAACPGPYTTYSDYLRNAQTFRALRSGQLTSASIQLYLNDEGADFDMEIWAVNQANVPSTVLAGTTIANVPKTIAPGPCTLTGTFATPATVVAGLRYALVITGRENQLAYILAHSNDVCPDGNLFLAIAADAVFVPAPSSELGFATFVTA
jgi:hypothetical protein